MTNNPRRPVLVPLNRHIRKNDATVINATALPRSVSYTTVNYPMEQSPPPPPKDSLPQDPFVSISRAIQTAKLRAGARIRTMSSANYPRSRYKALQKFARKATRFFAIALAFFVLLEIVSHQPLTSRENVSFWNSLRLSAAGKNPFDTPSMRHQLRHRPKALTTRNFDTGPWVIALVADLDKESCRIHHGDVPPKPAPCSKANAWVSYLKRGILKIPSANPINATEVRWLDELELEGRGHFEVEAGEHGVLGGRGFELSELEWFHGHLLAPDDHTGLLLEIMSPRGLLDPSTRDEFYGSPSNVPPSTFHRAMLHDGSGDDHTAAFKSEWMVVKNDELIIGGHGKAYTDPMDGRKVKSNNPKWIKVVTKDFKVSHINWTARYDAVAESAGVPFPGYLMHETVLWSPERSEWVFLPRRRSPDPFNSKSNEEKGWNCAIIASDDFKHIKAVEIPELRDPSGLKGFSSAKFVPGTSDRLVAALRTVEVDPTPTRHTRETATYFSVFELPSGRIIHKEERVSRKKYEGLVFL